MPGYFGAERLPRHGIYQFLQLGRLADRADNTCTALE